MKKSITSTVVALVLVFGFGLGAFAAKKGGVDSAAWQGTAQEAAERLLDLAAVLAGGGSWENIYVARVHYLSGDRQGGEAILNRFSQGKPGDLIRVARVYAQAGEWEKAKPLFDRVIALTPKDADWLIEVGAYYNLNGDRDTAEQLFQRGFTLSPKSLNNTLTAAGSYLGLQPRKR